jgi:proline iminopeptidase
MDGYLDYSGRDDVLSGGARRIPVTTPAGTYRVWVKRTGSNPALRVLLLHGGPGSTHEYLEACDSFLPAVHGLAVRAALHPSRAPHAAGSVA